MAAIYRAARQLTALQVRYGLAVSPCSSRLLLGESLHQYGRPRKLHMSTHRGRRSSLRCSGDEHGKTAIPGSRYNIAEAVASAECVTSSHTRGSTYVCSRAEGPRMAGLGQTGFITANLGGFLAPDNLIVPPFRPRPGARSMPVSANGGPMVPGQPSGDSSAAAEIRGRAVDTTTWETSGHDESNEYRQVETSRSRSAL